MTKSKGLLQNPSQTKERNLLVDSVDPVDSVEDPITVWDVLGTRSLASEEAVAVTFLFDFS